MTLHDLLDPIYDPIDPSEPPLDALPDAWEMDLSIGGEGGGE